MVFCVILLALFSIGCSQSSNDQIPSEYKHYMKYRDFLSFARTGGVYVVTFDQTKDGVADRWIYLDPKKTPRDEYMSTVDNNYDGIVDKWLYWEATAPFIGEIDTNFDGKIDVWRYRDRGTGYDTDGDGKPDKVVPARTR